MKKIVLVEDDTELARLVKMFLESEGFEIEHIADGTDATRQIESALPDLIVLDVMLPGKSGIEICKQVRAFYSGPILMLTACEDDITEVSALNIGADNYLGKPVKPHTLLAHINSLLRRANTLSKTLETIEVFAGDLLIDTSRREVRMAGRRIDITTAEYDLLALLASSPGKVVSRDECYKKLRGMEYDGEDRAMDVRVSELRKKFYQISQTVEPIKTVRGKGYLLVLK